METKFLREVLCSRCGKVALKLTEGSLVAKNLKVYCCEASPESEDAFDNEWARLEALFKKRGITF